MKLEIRTANNGIRMIINKYTLECILLVISIAIALMTPGFLTPSNLLNILRNISLQGVIAFGMTMVIIAGEIDLSIGSTVALTGVIIALTSGSLAKAGIMPMETGVIVGIVLAFVLAALIGLFNGWLLTTFKIPSFIITLAMLNALYGITAIISKGFPVTTLPRWYNMLGAGHIFSIPIPAIILVIVFIIISVIMNRTKFGRAVYAVGGNPEAARLSGINVRRVKITVMIAVQVLAALSGMLVSSQVMAGSSTFGRGWELNVIASVIIGGASLFGGIGKVWGTFIGLAFLGVLINGMTLLNINEYVQYVVRGLLILAAVLINTMQTQPKQ
ncbi:ribose transport system permease protein [Thermanaeromonas toyohensis ToBE]|uniref:Ribose transport system permease protein n=1 Tax=Thermanaeromonas toyohensis ToBE TaxID=698762 RepID=A0A1W1VC10_9FIRM|nr:ABC transporter permease [Thermanaeromonas toyohensis]SMB90898.1 ribose transport system permease protein [Thermanaeromonas toyohensis ToBE]